MNNFVNDERVVGKWKKLAEVKSIEDFSMNKFEDDIIFDFEQVYFLPNGAEYWVFSWTKGFLYVKNRPLAYHIEEDKLFIEIFDFRKNKIMSYAVYEKVDSKHYTKEEISVKDDIKIDFKEDEKVVGEWNCIDFVREFDDFKPDQKFWNGDLIFTKYIFKNEGTLVVNYKRTDENTKLAWSKGVVINKNLNTVSKYTIRKIKNKEIMFIEWKSGDYILGGKINWYYVFEKVK